ncbi:MULTISPECIES: hypothetical protein [unclassified Pseudomonas]|uniref:hypothetical protein n=1 Tax=unclassified Pseudomonas TaxID=196821 RepID=UPI0030D994A1
MSRYGFFKVINEPDESSDDLEDLLGYGLYDWLNHGVAGYDPNLQTYFFNLESSWIIGTTPAEIPTIADLQCVLAAIFNGARLPFNSEGLLQIAAGGEHNPIILAPDEAATESSKVSKQYLTALRLLAIKQR